MYCTRPSHKATVCKTVGMWCRWCSRVSLEGSVVETSQTRRVCRCITGNSTQVLKACTLRSIFRPALYRPQLDVAFDPDDEPIQPELDDPVDVPETVSGGI